MDSTGGTIDFLLSPKRDAVSAKLFLRLALWNGEQIRPRVITADGRQVYAHASSELKENGVGPAISVSTLRISDTVLSKGPLSCLRQIRFGHALYFG
jgi:transposase-like protein